MSLMMRHVILPLLAPLAFFAVGATPVAVLGCRNRGLLALLIALIGALGSIAATVAGTRGRGQGRPDSGWWAATALIMAVPAIALLFLA